MHSLTCPAGSAPSPPYRHPSGGQVVIIIGRRGRTAGGAPGGAPPPASGHPAAPAGPGGEIARSTPSPSPAPGDLWRGPVPWSMVDPWPAGAPRETRPASPRHEPERTPRGGNGVKKPMLVLASVAALALAVSSPAMAQAQKKTLAVVVKGLDNPFFTVLGNGCALWNKENPKSEYKCLYTGPASSADETGEVQIVEDLINKGVAGIAISPSNAPAMAKMLKAKNPKMPIMTIDADLAAADRALRKTYLGTNNYDMGVLMAKHLKGLNPKGGTVCLQLGNVAADNINARAQGFRDTISGKKRHRSAEGRRRLDGDQRLPALHQRPDRPRQPADGGHLHRQPQPGRIHPRRRMGAVRPAGLRAGHRSGHGQAQVEEAHHHRRRHPAAADGRAEGGSEPRADRAAPVRDGPSGPRGADRPDQRQEGRRSALHRPGRVHRPRTWASARRGGK